MTRHESWLLAAVVVWLLTFAAGWAVGYYRSYRRGYWKGWHAQQDRWEAWADDVERGTISAQPYDGKHRG